MNVKDTFICPNFVVEFHVTDSVVQRLARVYLVGLGLLLLVHESSFGQMPFLLIQVESTPSADLALLDGRPDGLPGL